MEIVMEADEDLAYFEKRAEIELDLAQKAGHVNAVRAHYMMAGFYLDRVYGEPDGSAAASQLPINDAR
jgi:hypothetical protein